jgi:hypothetical protein
MQVRPNSIWPPDASTLTKWQELKRRGDRAALDAYRKQELDSRDAWQFLYPLTAKILGYNPASHQVHVEMKTAGRFVGTDWWIDSHAIVP